MTKILEKRIDALEKRLAAVERRTAPPMANGPTVTSATGEKFVWANPDNAWLEGLFGRFKDDPDFEDAMRLGREYRERQPKC